MKSKSDNRRDPDLFRESLGATINLKNGLVRLSGLVPWSTFDEAFGKYTSPNPAAHPSNSGLYLKALRILVRQAKRHGVILRRGVMPMPSSSSGCAP